MQGPSLGHRSGNAWGTRSGWITEAPLPRRRNLAAPTDVFEVGTLTEGMGFTTPADLSWSDKRHGIDGAVHYMSTRTGIWVAILLVYLTLTPGCSRLGPEGTHQAECAPDEHTVDAPRVTIRTDRELYVPGEPILVIVHNNLMGSIEYVDGCSLHLCHLVGGQRVCEMKECHGPTTVLGPGAVAEIRDYASAAGGNNQTYRLYYLMLSDDAPGIATSNTFSITGAEPNSRNAIPLSSLTQYFEVLASEDYHEAARRGKDLFGQGLVIPNHDELLSEFASSDMDHARTRYSLYSFHGEASAGEVYLIVGKKSGEIIEFNYVEASFER